MQCATLSYQSIGYARQLSNALSRTHKLRQGDHPGHGGRAEADQGRLHLQQTFLHPSQSAESVQGRRAGEPHRQQHRGEEGQQPVGEAAGAELHLQVQRDPAPKRS